MMRTLKAIFPALGLAFGACAVAVAPFVSSSVYAADEQKVSVKVGKPLQEALTAGQQKKWDEAAAKLRDAEKIEEKTPYDQFKIDEIFGWVYSNQKKYKEAAVSYEKTLNSSFLPSEDADMRLRAVASLYLQAKDLQKAAEYLQRLQKAHPADTVVGEQLAQVYYQLGQYKPAIDAIQNVIASAEKAGQQPKEPWLQILLTSAFKLQDNKGSQNSLVLGTLEKLVRYYPKPVYWENLLSGMTQQTNDLKDKDTYNFELYRLMLDIGTLKKPEDYVEFAQLANKGLGLPGEAEIALEAGFMNGVLGNGPDKDKHSRLLKDAKEAAAADKNSLPDQEKKAKQAPTGQPDVGLGEAYSSYGQYPQAIEAIERGLKKGSVKNRDQAQIALGVAYLRANQKDKAKAAFKAVNPDSELGRIASLWALKASSAG